MKRLGLIIGVPLVAAAFILGISQLPAGKLSIRLMHPRSSQLIPKIESGQAVVPANFEVLEVNDAAPIPDDRVLVSRTVRLTEEDIASVEMALAPNRSDIYLQLTEEGSEELSHLVQDYPDRNLVIVTEDGEVMPVQRSGSRNGRLAIHLNPGIKKAEAQALIADLR